MISKGDIAYILDSNTEMYGRFVENIPIVDFKTVKNECDVIIVAINDREAFKEIKDKIYRESPWIEVRFFAEFLTYEE